MTRIRRAVAVACLRVAGCGVVRSFVRSFVVFVVAAVGGDSGGGA